MENGKHQVYEFGGFQLDPARHALLRHGQPVALTPKLFETLVLLVENRDRTLPKDEMMQALWAETFVEEGNLSQNIFLLRKALGDDRNGHSFIHTIPRKGYRFVAPVVETEAGPMVSIPGAPGADYWKRNSPFRSLTVFEPQDAWLFFGREAETAELVERVARSPVVVVIGNSGSGKSSLLRAGLIPALCEGNFPQTNGSGATLPGESWRIAVVRPSASPFDYLAEAVVGQLASELSLEEHSNFVDDCRRKLPGCGDALRNAVIALTLGGNNGDPKRSSRVLLVVDQFEELFTLTQKPAVRDRYLDVLLAAAGLDSAVPVHVVFSLRADFYGHCLDHAGLRRCLEASFNLGSMTAEQMRETIERRLALAGGRAETGLIDALLEDVGAEPGNLALLEHALGQLWEQRGGPGCTFTNFAYNQMGRLRGALGRHADAVFQSLADDDQRRLAQRIFLELVHLGEGAQDTRRRVAKAELIKLGEPSQVEQLLAQLASSRLIATGREGEETFVEVSHEALIREWPTLRQWLEENREELALERRLVQAAQEWESLNRDRGALLQGARLAQAEDWLDRRQEASDSPGEYVQASVAARNENARNERAAQRRELKRFRWFSWTVSIFLVIAIGSAWFAYHQRIIEKSRAMAAQAEEMASRDRGQALDLAIRSWQVAKTDEAHFAVARTFPEPVLTIDHGEPVDWARFSPDGARILSLSNSSARLWDARQGRLLKILEQGQGVGQAAFSSDGRHLVTAGQDHSVRVWDAIDGKLIASLPGHTALVETAAFSPDGKLIVTGGMDKTARVWDWQQQRGVATLKGHSNSVVDAEFSPDGRYVVTASRDKTARVWDSVTGRVVMILRGHRDEIATASFSPGGSLILTSGADNTARLWSSADGQPLRVLQHRGIVESARFSPDGQLIATASFDNAARIWNVKDGRLVATLSHDGPVEDICFSADGRLLMTNSRDRTARIWNTRDGRLLAVLRGHTAEVTSASFSPSGDQVVTASADKTVRTWNLSAAVTTDILRHQSMVTVARFSPDGRMFVTASSETARLWNTSDVRLRAVLIGHSDRILDAVFSPDGKKLLTTSQDGTARVWSIPSGRLLMVLRGHTNYVIAGSFSPDGQRVVTASWDHTARVWRSEDGHLLAVLQGLTGPVRSASFSHDGERILTASDDHTARVWSAVDGRLLFVLAGHTADIRHAEFSPDGYQIVTASQDETARLWNAADGRLLATLQGHAGPLYHAMFSPDGRQILTFGRDLLVRIWDTSTGKQVTTLEGHTNLISKVQFSPDRRHILTASYDNTARLWDASDGHLEHTLQGHTWQVISAAFFPDGKQIITASLDQTARIWEILTLDDIERILSK